LITDARLRRRITELGLADIQALCQVGGGFFTSEAQEREYGIYRKFGHIPGVRFAESYVVGTFDSGLDSIGQNFNFGLC
jgi:hypothetical protein